MGRLPESFVEENLKKGKNSIFCGISIREMTRDELMACFIFLCLELRDERREHMRQLNFLLGKPDHVYDGPYKIDTETGKMIIDY